MTVNSFTVFDWVSFARVPFVILHHIVCISYALRKKRVSPIVRVVLIIFGLDLFDLIPESVHDFLAILLDKEIYPDFLLAYIGFTQCFRWYGILSLVCYMAFLHLWSIYDISRVTAILVFCTAICLPLLTPFSGFIYNTGGHFWSFDREKPGYDLYVYWNWIAQGICLLSIISADLYVIYFLQRYRKRRKAAVLLSFTTTQQNIESSLPSSKITPVLPVTPAVVIRNCQIKPKKVEKSLAFCFIFFSLCFLLATVSFNFLGGLNSSLVKVIQMVAKWLEYFKFTPYIWVLRT
ncbi:unnamed protein product, partial [Mesorhabditis spiculigera]